jgi:hypothetical protein
LFVLSLGLAVPAAAQTATARGVCSSWKDPAVLYLTPVFDTKLKAGDYRSRRMSYEFGHYLKGLHDLKTTDPFAAGCGSYRSDALAESARQTLEQQAAQSHRKVVAVPWTYDPDPAEVAFANTAVRTDATDMPDLPAGPSEEGFCVSDSFATPQYLSAVFRATSANLGEWQGAWMKYLAVKYGYKGDFSCDNTGRGDPKRNLAARAAGARAAGRQVIDTGWKYGAPVPVAATHPDDDLEPAPAPKPAAPPPQQLRDLATSDGNAALTYCQNDRMLNGPLDCYAVQRTVYNYRMSHPTAEPVASLLQNDKLDCSTCFNQFMEMWASNRAMSNGYNSEKSQCVGPKFVAAMKAQPYVNRVHELFDAAMKACPK